MQPTYHAVWHVPQRQSTLHQGCAESPAARAAGAEKAELQVPHHLTRFASPPGVYIPIAWRKNASAFRSICARASESSSW